MKYLLSTLLIAVAVTASTVGDFLKAANDFEQAARRVAGNSHALRTKLAGLRPDALAALAIKRLEGMAGADKMDEGSSLILAVDLAEGEFRKRNILDEDAVRRLKVEQGELVAKMDSSVPREREEATNQFADITKRIEDAEEGRKLLAKKLAAPAVIDQLNKIQRVVESIGQVVLSLEEAHTRYVAYRTHISTAYLQELTEIDPGYFSEQSMSAVPFEVAAIAGLILYSQAEAATKDENFSLRTDFAINLIGDELLKNIREMGKEDQSLARLGITIEGMRRMEGMGPAEAAMQLRQLFQLLRTGRARHSLFDSRALDEIIRMLMQVHVSAIAIMNPVHHPLLRAILENLRVGETVSFAAGNEGHFMVASYTRIKRLAPIDYTVRLYNVDPYSSTSHRRLSEKIDGETLILPFAQFSPLRLPDITGSAHPFYYTTSSSIGAMYPSISSDLRKQEVDVPLGRYVPLQKSGACIIRSPLAKILDDLSTTVEPPGQNRLVKAALWEKVILLVARRLATPGLPADDKVLLEMCANWAFGQLQLDARSSDDIGDRIAVSLALFRAGLVDEPGVNKIAVERVIGTWNEKLLGSPKRMALLADMIELAEQGDKEAEGGLKPREYKREKKQKDNKGEEF